MENVGSIHSVSPKTAMQHSHKFTSAAQPYVAGRVGAISAQPSRGLETAANITEARHEACADVPALPTSWSQTSCQCYCLIFHTLAAVSPYICTGCGGLWDLQGKHHLSLLLRSLIHSHVQSAQLSLHTVIPFEACRLHTGLLTYLRSRSWSDLGSLRKRLHETYAYTYCTAHVINT